MCYILPEYTWNIYLVYEIQKIDYFWPIIYESERLLNDFTYTTALHQAYNISYCSLF